HSGLAANAVHAGLHSRPWTIRVHLPPLGVESSANTALGRRIHPLPRDVAPHIPPSRAGRTADGSSSRVLGSREAVSSPYRIVELDFNCLRSLPETGQAPAMQICKIKLGEVDE